MAWLTQKNWGRALGEVAASLVGALGIVYVISLIYSAQDTSITSGQAFGSYFSGGQIGLAILSVSSVTFISLLRHKPAHQIVSLMLLIFLFGPVVATSIIIGMNPGFVAGGLSKVLLVWMWWMFLGLHILWFIILLLEPTLPNAQQAGQAQEDRVNRIKSGATGGA
jgi:hypothetical protein